MNNPKTKDAIGNIAVTHRHEKCRNVMDSINSQVITCRLPWENCRDCSMEDGEKIFQQMRHTYWFLAGWPQIELSLPNWCRLVWVLTVLSFQGAMLHIAVCLPWCQYCFCANTCIPCISIAGIMDECPTNNLPVIFSSVILCYIPEPGTAWQLGLGL